MLPADWSIAGAGLSPARKTAAVGCTVEQDKGSAVPHHGFGIFRPESGTFLSRNALLEAQGMVCCKGRIGAAFVHLKCRIQLRLAAPQRKADLRCSDLDLNPRSAGTEHREFMAAGYGPRSANHIGDSPCG